MSNKPEKSHQNEPGALMTEISLHPWNEQAVLQETNFNIPSAKSKRKRFSRFSRLACTHPPNLVEEHDENQPFATRKRHTQIDVYSPLEKNGFSNINLLKREIEFLEASQVESKFPTAHVFTKCYSTISNTPKQTLLFYKGQKQILKPYHQVKKPSFLIQGITAKLPNEIQTKPRARMRPHTCNSRNLVGDAILESSINKMNKMQQPKITTENFWQEVSSKMQKNQNQQQIKYTIYEKGKNFTKEIQYLKQRQYTIEKEKQSTKEKSIRKETLSREKQNAVKAIHTRVQLYTPFKKIYQQRKKSVKKGNRIMINQLQGRQIKAILHGFNQSFN